MDIKKRGSVYNLPYTEYKVLLEAVTSAGYFRRTYLAHAFVLTSALTGIVFSCIIVVQTSVLWIQILNACLFAFCTIQLGFIGHDLSHQGVFASKRANHFWAVLVWGLGIGLSEGRWFYKHSQHHKSPNHIGHDPDVDIPFIFDSEQAHNRSNFQKKYILPYQHILFWVGIWFVYPYNIMNSMKYLFRRRAKKALLEGGLMVVHFSALLWLTFLFLPLHTALLFITTVFLFRGVYMALVFAPNHKGEDMLLPEQEHNWIHQITLTRNLYSFPLLSYIFGGLERQIEHHLFPKMSRFQYHKAQKIVKRFCRERQIPYHETTWFDSLRQIHRSLKNETQAW